MFFDPFEFPNVEPASRDPFKRRTGSFNNSTKKNPGGKKQRKAKRKQVTAARKRNR